MTESPSYDIVNLVHDLLYDSDSPVWIEDNTYPRRMHQSLTDPIAMINASPPAYRVLVSVNGSGPDYFGPWVAVTHTERFGFTPGMDGYTYLYPPNTADSVNAESIVEWLASALRDAVAKHTPAAAKAKADDAGTPGPIEARDAIRRIG